MAHMNTSAWGPRDLVQHSTPHTFPSLALQAASMGTPFRPASRVLPPVNSPQPTL